MVAGTCCSVRSVGTWKQKVHYHTYPHSSNYNNIFDILTHQRSLFFAFDCITVYGTEALFETFSIPSNSDIPPIQGCVSPSDYFSPGLDFTLRATVSLFLAKKQDRGVTGAEREEKSVVKLVWNKDDVDGYFCCFQLAMLMYPPRAVGPTGSPSNCQLFSQIESTSKRQENRHKKTRKNIMYGYHVGWWTCGSHICVTVRSIKSDETNMMPYVQGPIFI